MFGLFKRTKIESWEIAVLVNVLQKMPPTFHMHINYINEGLFNRVLIGFSDIPGYVGFSYHPEIYEKFYQPDDRDYRIEGILVFDTVSKKYLDYTIYFSYGVINGYSISGAGKFKIDPEKIDPANMELKLWDNADFNRLEKVLTPNEIDLINPSDVYLIVLEGKEYFHLTAIEDGDFYAMDEEKKLYKITHDPYQIEKIDISLADLLGVD